MSTCSANTFTYSLVPGSGDDDNASFQIFSDSLITNGTFDFETKNSYVVRVQTDDGHGGTFERAFTITINDVNDAPTGTSTWTMPRYSRTWAQGTMVGRFTTHDQDVADSHTYTLFDDATYPDNTSFQITGHTLQTAASFDFEAQSSYSIRVRTTDAGGLSFDKAFTITVTDVNEAPTDIALSNSSVAENQPSAPRSARFVHRPRRRRHLHLHAVSGRRHGQRRLHHRRRPAHERRHFDYETQPSRSIKVRTTDAGGLSFEKVFTITVTNVNEAPDRHRLEQQPPWPRISRSARPSARCRPPIRTPATPSPTPSRPGAPTTPASPSRATSSSPPPPSTTRPNRRGPSRCAPPTPAACSSRRPSPSPSPTSTRRPPTSS